VPREEEWPVCSGLLYEPRIYPAAMNALRQNNNTLCSHEAVPRNIGADEEGGGKLRVGLLCIYHKYRLYFAHS
jgi:hypothetical protein